MKVKLCFSLLLSAVLCFAQGLDIKSLTVDDYLSDLAILNNIIDKQHPNPYKFVSKKQQQASQKKAIREFKANPSYALFSRSLLPRLGDIHLRYNIAREFLEGIFRTYDFFPFPVIVKRGRMFVNIKGDVLPYGTEIIAINNQSIKNILHLLNKYVHGDGYILTNTETQVTSSFDMLYAYYLNNTVDGFKISYLSEGTKKSMKLNTINYYEAFRKRALAINPVNKFELSEPIILRYYEAQKLGVITVNTFELSEPQAYQSFSLFFKNVNTLKLETIVVDLRDNGGGDPNIAALLFSFLVNKNFKNEFNYKMRNIKIVHNNLTHANGVPFSDQEVTSFNNFLYQRFDQKDSSYVGNDRLKEGLLYDFPADKDHFDKNAYVIVGGNTASAAVYFAKLFKDYQRGKIIGTETGGNENNTFAGFFLHYKLPKTKIIVTLPITELLFDTTKQTTRGIMPDITIPVEREMRYIRQEKDPELQYIMDKYITNNP